MEKELTKQQAVFVAGQKKLKQLEAIQKERPLTEVEKMKKEEIMTRLWTEIKRYAISLIREIISKYPRISSDTFSDLLQMLALAFCEKLPEYDPLRSTPTTYFVRHFKQKISEYIHAEITRQSQYDSQNSRNVKRAEAYYESRGIRWTEDMIANRTGLSIKVVKSTIEKMHRTSYQHLDDVDAPPVASKIDSPEKHFIEEQSKQVLYDRIDVLLTEDEKELFMARVNQDQAKELPYADVADQFGMPLNEVKQKINNIRCRLNQDPILCAQFGYGKSRITVGTIHFEDNAEKIMESQILSTFK